MRLVLLAALGGLAARAESPLQKACATSQGACFNEIERRTVRVENPQKHGTGFVLRSEADALLILTAGHLAVREELGKWILETRLRVVIDGRSIPALGVCAFQPLRGDIALIRVPNENRVPVKQPAWGKVAPATWAYVVERSGDRARRFQIKVLGTSTDDRILLSNPLWPGTSGAALLTPTGAILGVNTSLRRLSLGDHEVELGLGTAGAALPVALSLPWKALVDTSRKAPEQWVCGEGTR